MHRKELQRFAKNLAYALGVRPDEFGLVPDPEGYVAMKELLQALREESEWSFIGRGHLLELSHSQERERFDFQENRIRVVSPKIPLTPEPWDSPPPLLFHGIRRRAHPVVLRHGLRPPKGPWVVMSVTREMALRIGKRRDQDPVILEVNAREAALSGVQFYKTHGLLALATAVPPEFLIGPPLIEEEPKRPVPKPGPRIPVELPGSFFPDLQDLAFKGRDDVRRDKKSWKREKRRPQRTDRNRRRG